MLLLLVMATIIAAADNLVFTLILNQVRAGVSVRMAVLYRLLAGADEVTV